MFISVIIPAFNRRERLKLCIDSLLEQSLGRDKYEIIVVDDGSTDGTAVLLQEYVKRRQIVYMRQEHRGPAAARNIGIFKANGDAFFFTGDDMIADRQLLETHYRELEGAPEDTAILGLVVWHPEISATPFMRFLEQGTQFNFVNLSDNHFVNYGYFATANVSLRKTLIAKTGGFDEEFLYPCVEDVEFAWRLGKAGMRLKHIKAAKVFHYHPTRLKDYVKRQYLVGRSLIVLVKKHPQKFKAELGNFAHQNIYWVFLKGMAAWFLVYLLEPFGESELLFRCYVAVLNFYELKGFKEQKINYAANTISGNR
ncbi:MAG: glycosyltransferase family 2 protein [Candidatus Omnitrophota bacterium]